MSYINKTPAPTFKDPAVGRCGLFPHDPDKSTVVTDFSSHSGFQPSDMKSVFINQPSCDTHRSVSVMPWIF